MSYKIEGKDIVISGFEEGIADDPYQGISDMRNVNNSSIPTEASVALATVQSTYSSVSGSVASADAGTDIVTFSGLTGSLGNYKAVVFAGGSLPSGIVAGTIYYLGNVSGLTAKLYTAGDLRIGSLINIGGTGTGTFTSIVMAPVTYFATATFRGTGLPLYEYFAVDTSGRVWVYYTTASTWVYLRNTTLTGAYGNGLGVYHGYLFSWRAASLDYIPLADYFDSSTWVYGWFPPTGSGGIPISNLGLPDSPFSHETFIGTDDAMYSCDATYLQSFIEAAGEVFDPTDPTTYVWSQKALAAPTFDTFQSLSELGINLMVGGASNYIYPWNRISTSFTYPIYVPEAFIKKMVTVNTTTYIFAGRRGRIYITNGSQAQLFKKVPDHISGTVEPYYSWGGVAADKDNVYFGVQAATNGGVAINQYGGLWAINVDTGALRLLNKLSYNTYAGLATAILVRNQNSALTPPPGYGLYIGWNDGSNNGGIDTYSGFPYIGGESIVTSDMIPIGTYLKPFTPSQLEWKVSQPLVAGESVALYYSPDLSTAFAPISTATSSLVGQISDLVYANFQKVQWVRIQAVLTSTNTTPTYTRLTEIRIRDYPSA